MVLSDIRAYNHKLFGFIHSSETEFCGSGKSIMVKSPEPKGTLTPPGSSPLRPDCGQPAHFTHGSIPSSPETPLTPDSAQMAADAASHNGVLRNEGGDLRISLSHEPLTGARKRKATKVHKVEAECITRLERDSLSSPGLTCSVCQAVLTSQHDFTRHIRTHNRVIEDDCSGTKLFECGLCQKLLSSNSSLDRHMLVHSGERPFRCHICGTHFTTNGNMHRHIRGHYRNGGGMGGGSSDTGDSDGGSEGGQSPTKRKLEDDDLGGVIKMPRLISLHDERTLTDDDSSSKEMIPCHFCGIEFNESSSLETHIEKKHKEKIFSLKTNIQITSPGNSISSLNISPLFNVCHNPEDPKHRDLSRSSPTAPHSCSTCGISFASIEEWVLHLRKHPHLKCPSCNSSFDSISDYTFHQQQHANYELVRCRLSPSNASSLFSPSLHLQVPSPQLPQISSDFKMRLLSEITPLALTRQQPSTPKALPQHSNNSTTLSHDEQFARDYKDMKMNGQYPCRLCKEIFANLRKLKSHNLIHMITPPYQCNLCSFVSNDKNTLKEHMKTHKGDTPYECILCSLSFTTKANCERHIKNIHGRQTRDEVKKCMTYTPQEEGRTSQESSADTVCNLCKFDCKSRSVLRDHIRSSHPDEIHKPYSCKLCQVTFLSRSDAFRHAIQAHQDAVSSGSLENLVEKCARADDLLDLSPVENIISASNLSLPIASDTNKTLCPESPEQTLDVDLHQSKSPSFSCSSNTVISPPLNIPTYSISSPCEDAPLDLSVNKKKKHEDDLKAEEDEEDVADVTIIDDDDNGSRLKVENTGILSPIKKLSKLGKDKSNLNSSPGSPLPDLNCEFIKDMKHPFPMMYPNQLPVPFYSFQTQYPFLMHPFGPLPPVANFDQWQFLQHYQKEIKQLTSGGSILNHENVGNSLLNSANSQLLNTNGPSYPLSAITQDNYLKNKCSEDEGSNDGRTRVDSEAASSNRDSEEIGHFTMRNAVLVKKPKQRRYRTERPWRCDLCDKGFTLRSNMERHMKQQHPDLWQQRPKGSSTPRTGISSTESSKMEVKSPFKDEILQESADALKEDEENELIIDDEEYEEMGDGDAKEECGADLASVGKLVSTASQNFTFFTTENEETESQNSSPCTSPTSQGNLTEEKRSAYSSAPQKQKCPFCHRKFPWSSSLVRHIRTHTGQKPYLCPVCHFPFTTKSNCDRHLQRKHPDSPHAFSGDRPYKCCKCPMSAFTSLESLRKHDMFKHEKAVDNVLRLRERDDDKMPLQLKPFGCYICECRHYSTTEVLQHLAEKHPESFKTLQVEDIASSFEQTSPARESSSEVDSSPESAASEMIRCMLCFQKYSSGMDLKSHIEMAHTQCENAESGSVEEAASGSMEETKSLHPSSPKDEPIVEQDHLEIKQTEKETSDFLSNMLGTKPDVIDHLINSKSTSAADSAKLLGVR